MQRRLSLVAHIHEMIPVMQTTFYDDFCTFIFHLIRRIS